MRYLVGTVLLLSSLACLGGKDKDEDEDLDDALDDGDDADDAPDEDPGSDTNEPPDDTGGGPGGDAVFIDYIEAPGCVGNKWYYYAETTGWTGTGNLVNAWEWGANGVNEEHDLPSIEFEPDGAWDILERALNTDVFPPVRNQSTAYGCEGGAVPVYSLVYAIRVYDVDENYADCAIFEQDYPGGVEDVYAGTVSEGFAAVTARHELNPSDCVEWTLP